VGSWEIDLTTLRVTWTDEVHCIFETSPATFQPTVEAVLKLVHPSDRELVREAWLRSKGQHPSCGMEHRIQLPGARTKLVEQRWQVFRDGANQPLRILGTCRDITEE
jgi:PAS domain-containing protein